MANIVNFTDKQFENRLNDNLEELVQGKKAVESPTAFLLGVLASLAASVIIYLISKLNKKVKSHSVR